MRERERESHSGLRSLGLLRCCDLVNLFNVPIAALLLFALSPASMLPH